VLEDFGFAEPPNPSDCEASGVDAPAIAEARFEFRLDPLTPNPVRGKIEVRFSVPRRTLVTMDVYNVNGQRVRRLVDEMLDGGVHGHSWDGVAQSGEAVANGVYFVRLEADGRSASRKLVLLR
jgi:hypothetical protein